MSTQSIRRSVALNVLTGARGALGVIALFTPRIGARMFRIDADGTPAIVMGRLFGIRNVALAAGLLRLDATTVPRMRECETPQSSAQKIGYWPGVVAWNQMDVYRPGSTSCFNRKPGT